MVTRACADGCWFPSAFSFWPLRGVALVVARPLSFSLLPSLREAKLERLASDGGGSVGGAVAAWVPLGHDVYVIGVQECLALDELRRAIHARLGGDGAYRMYTAEIGSTK